MAEQQETKYLGVQELSELLGWTRSKTHTYYRRGVIEQPKAFVGNRPLWTEKQAERIAKLNK